jgi:hypothetical protein
VSSELVLGAPWTTNLGNSSLRNDLTFSFNAESTFLLQHIVTDHYKCAAEAGEQ